MWGGLASRATALQRLGLAISAGAGIWALILRTGNADKGMAMTWLAGALYGAGWAELRLAARVLPLMLPLLLS